MISFDKRPPRVSPNIARSDEVIEDIISRMKDLEPESKEYASATDQLVKMIKIQEEVTTPEDRISLDTMVTVGAQLLGILLVLNFERANVITSKALGFITKLR